MADTLKSPLQDDAAAEPLRPPVPRDNMEERFWAKVDSSSECWLWTASVTRQGIGQFKVDRRMVQAHRKAWELVNGMPAPAVLRHACGNAKCVRPGHLRPMRRRAGPVSLARPAGMRFNELVDRTAECWNWSGSVDRLGYGQFRDFDDRAAKAGRMVRAHRFAWEAAHGPLEPGVHVIQACRNRRCVRPDHLAIRADGDPPSPTSRQLEVLALWVALGMRRGDLNEVARVVGISNHGARQHLYDLRKRLRVRTTAEALSWLSDHMPLWRT